MYFCLPVILHIKHFSVETNLPDQSEGTCYGLLTPCTGGPHIEHHIPYLQYKSNLHLHVKTSTLYHDFKFFDNWIWLDRMSIMSIHKQFFNKLAMEYFLFVFEWWLRNSIFNKCMIWAFFFFKFWVMVCVIWYFAHQIVIQSMCHLSRKLSVVKHKFSHQK